MTPNQNPASVSLSDLVDLKEWQKIQDNFSFVTDVSLKTIDSKGSQITSPSSEPRLCSCLLSNSALKTKFCGSCLPTFLGGKEVVDKNLSFTCEAGLCNFLAPLRYEERVFGYFILGPVVLVMRKAKEDYQRLADELNLELDALWSAILEVKIVSFQGMQSLVELIQEIGEYIIRQGFGLKPSADLNRLLNLLLEVAFQVTGADVGSIMFLDDKKEELTIRASKGIPEEIAAGAKVSLGFGVSGIVAKERRPLLIDDEFIDRRIQPFLNRNNISSSMVVPIESRDKIWGVLSLGALRSSAVRFSQDNISVLDKLVNLASIAFYP